MTMTETPTTAPAKKPARRAKPRAKAAPAPAVPKESIMAGITVTDCPSACTATRCVISSVGICAHPGKGGLQAMLQNPDSLRRFNEAKRVLGKAKLDLRDA